MLLIILQYLLSDEQLTNEGWCIPFVMGAIWAVGIFYLRRGMHGTDAYSTLEKADKDSRRGTLAEVWKYRKAALLVFTLTLGAHVCIRQLCCAGRGIGPACGLLRRCGLGPCPGAFPRYDWA